MAFGHLSSGRTTRLAVPALILLTIIFAYSLIAFTDSALAGQVTVAWDTDTTPGVAGYKVYWGTVSRNYSWYADTATQTSYTVPSLAPGATYYIAATAYDGTRNESGFSNEVTYTVPSACTYATSPASQSLGAGGGTGSVNVTAGAACSWTTSNPASWISITSGASGTGNGTVNYSASPNTGTSVRTAGLTVAGTIITVNQAGAQTYTLTISNGGAGSGTVSSSPTGTTFSAGTSVTLTATPGANSTFTGWSGACSGTSSTCAVVMNSNLGATAAFNLQTHSISASAGSGGSISPSGSVNINGGSGQTFTITPNSGYVITSVTVDGTSVGKVSSYTFSNVTASHTINASFTGAAKTYSLAVTTGSGRGTVTKSPSGSSFSAGTVVTLTATPYPGFVFSSWSGACSGTSSTCAITMSSDASVTASFRRWWVY